MSHHRKSENLILGRRRLFVPYIILSGGNMFKFYNIDEDYVKYLQKIDKQVSNIHYRTNNKFGYL